MELFPSEEINFFSRLSNFLPIPSIIFKNVMIKVIFISILIVLIITLQTVRAEETIISGEIEIISDKINIFDSPLDSKKTEKKTVTSVPGVEGRSTSKDPFQSPLDRTDKQFTAFSANSTEPHGENPFIRPVTDDKHYIVDNKIDKQRNKEEKISAVSADNSLKYTGVLWNGSQYLGIITSDSKSYIVRRCDRLVEGYTVLYLDEKEIIVKKKVRKIQ